MWFVSLWWSTNWALTRGVWAWIHCEKVFLFTSLRDMNISLRQREKALAPYSSEDGRPLQRFVDSSVALIFKKSSLSSLYSVICRERPHGQGLAPLGKGRDMGWSKELPVHSDVLLMSWHLPCGPPRGLLTSITHTHRLVNLIILSPIGWCLTFHHGNDGRLFIFTLQAS